MRKLKLLKKIFVTIGGIGLIVIGVSHLLFYVTKPYPPLTLVSEFQIGWWFLTIIAGVFWTCHYKFFNK